jgi:hypothetical protein
MRLLRLDRSVSTPHSGQLPLTLLVRSYLQLAQKPEMTRHDGIIQSTREINAMAPAGVEILPRTAGKGFSPKLPIELDGQARREQARK